MAKTRIQISHGGRPLLRTHGVFDHPPTQHLRQNFRRSLRRFPCPRASAREREREAGRERERHPWGGESGTLPPSQILTKQEMPGGRRERGAHRPILVLSSYSEAAQPVTHAWRLCLLVAKLQSLNGCHGSRKVLLRVRDRGLQQGAESPR